MRTESALLFLADFIFVILRSDFLIANSFGVCNIHSIAYLCTRKTKIEGNPDIDHVSTSYVERSNLSVRMHTRRFTRLTNAFSKKVENHAHSVALFAMYYNFVRVHKTLRVTPAMAANVTKRLWEMSDIIDVLEAWEAKAA